MVQETPLELAIANVWQGIAPDAMAASSDPHDQADTLATCVTVYLSKEDLALWNAHGGVIEKLQLCKDTVERYS